MASETTENKEHITTAQSAGLQYIADNAPGFSRRKRGRGFVFLDEKGEKITDEKTLHRLNKLVIPPAWEDVWISPLPNGHLQVTGRDAKGRKQYMYHPLWNEMANYKKFDRMIEFGKSLPKLRKATDGHLRKKGMPREKVLATIVALMEFTGARIGNEAYAKENESYGLTTLRDKHVKGTGSKLKLQFKGKSGKQHSIELNSPQLARLVKRCKEIPGYELFQYYDGNGERHAIDSGDVNDYIREVTGRDFTAKDFRTWGGTVESLKCYLAVGPCASDKEHKTNTVQMVKSVAGRLRNTTAICRKYYIHPAIVDAYRCGELEKVYKNARGSNVPHGLTREENAVLKLLEKAYG